jgi:hypothetical protein
MVHGLSLAELTAAGIRLRPAEAVAIVADICRQHTEGRLPFIPSAGAIRLGRDGTIAVEGPISTSQDDIARAALLLNALLPDFDAPPEFRASGALRLVIARALGTLDLPRFECLEEFRRAIARFSSLDPRETVTSLHRAHVDAATADDLPWPERTLAATPATPDAAAALRPVRRRSWGVTASLSATALLLLASFAAGWHWVSSSSERPLVVEPAPAPAASAPVATAAPPVVAIGSTPREIQPAAFSPAFDRSGALYFHEQRGNGSVLKMAQTDDGGAITRLSDVMRDSALNFHIKPSPDGSRIAFDSDREGVRAVFVASADGRDARRISGPGYAAVPSWSPDGRRIAFVRADPGASHVWNLWMSDPDGGNIRRLTQHTVGQTWGASWFPDGRRIAYSVETRLIILDIETGQRQTFESPARGRLVRTPAVSPDGGRIIFQVHREGTWVFDVADARMRRVLDDPTAEEYAWTPDGRRVAFHSRRSGRWGVWLMAL